jgi:hypothetical protein
MVTEEHQKALKQIASGLFTWWVFLSVLFSLILGAATESWELPVLVSIFFLTLASAFFIYYHAKAYGRNAVRWATAFIIFSPLWAGIAYLLTWPKR